MIRDDISTKLIHLKKDIMRDDGTIVRSSDNFINIIRIKKLNGGITYIKGEFRCVCFSEVPICKFAYLFAAEKSREDFRYAHFGVMVEKDWLYKRGGRSVIYQSDREYDILHENQKYRHIRYEPDHNIDYTWEREWRIKVNELPLEPNNTTLIVPTRRWERIYIDAIIGSMRRRAAVPGPGSYPAGIDIKWHFIVLEDLGINIPWPDP